MLLSAALRSPSSARSSPAMPKDRSSCNHIIHIVIVGGLGIGMMMDGGRAIDGWYCVRTSRLSASFLPPRAIPMDQLVRIGRGPQQEPILRLPRVRPP